MEPKGKPRLGGTLRGLGVRPKRMGAPGAPPGTLEVARPETAFVSYIRIAEERFDERPSCTVDEAIAQVTPGAFTWINVDGIRDVPVLRRMGEHFGLHPLLVEDVANPNQRSKTEAYPNILFHVTHMAQVTPQGPLIEQISFVLGKDFLLSFQETHGDVFDSVRERIRTGQGRIRTVGPDYLFYRLLDAVVDGYFPVLEQFGTRLEELSDVVLDDPQPKTLHEIQQLRRSILGLRHAVWPMRDAVNTLIRDEHGLIAAETRVYLRDVYDHIVQLVDLLQTYYEMATSIMETYLSSVSHRMNEVMKLLTIIATIFIPLTFIVGVYGMNFDSSRSRWNMPELAWEYGYPAVWLVMGAMVFAQVVYFRRNGWL